MYPDEKGFSLLHGDDVQKIFTYMKHCIGLTPYVSVLALRTLVTGMISRVSVTWFQNAVIHSGELQALISVENRSSAFDVDSFSHFSRVPVFLSIQDSHVGLVYGVAGGDCVFSDRCRLVQLTMFFDSGGKGTFGFTDVNVVRVLLAG